LERVVGWLERSRPDVLLLQETKLADDDVPREAFERLGYRLEHHGEGRWNGVAVASRTAIQDVLTNFGEPLRPARTPEAGDDEPLAEARMIAVRTGGLRVVSLYAPNGRVVGSPFYQAKLSWFERLARWLASACSPAEREAFGRLVGWGLADAYRLHHAEGERFTWWDYRAGHFHKNFGMRIDHLLVSRPLAGRIVWAEIDREARKGQPTPSDHAPLLIDVDAPGVPLDGGWTGVDTRVAQRR